MTRQNIVAIALGGLALAMPPMCAQAQSGDALVRAESACFDNGVRPHSAAFNACVDRTARAFDRGVPEIAYRTARTAGDARDLCLSYGLPPDTLGYRQCVANTLNSLAAQAYVIRYHYAP